jgi:GTPase SAR1 family protein
MYLTEVWLEHIGPIDKCHIIMPFSDQYNPLPVLLVGPNGSGKTILLSYIVDALFEFAKTAYRDFVARDFENPNPYFRVVAGTNIQTGSLYSLALLQFKEGDQFLNYREKAGSLDPAEYESSIKQKFANMWSWPKDENSKSVTQNNNLMKETFDREAVCFFPTSRNEAPEWLNP